MSNGGEPSNFEVTKPGEAKILLTSAVPIKAKMQVWTSGQKFACRSKVGKVSESGNYLYVATHKDIAVIEFERNVRASGIERLLCSIHLPTDVIYFEGELKKGNPSELELKVDSTVYRLQRRRSLRIPFSGSDAPAATIQILPGDPAIIVAPVLNASEGGVAISLQDELEFMRLKVGTDIHRIRVNIAGVQVDCEADVRHAQEIPASPRLKKHYKVGLRFNGISEESMDRIARFVYETSAQFLGRI